MSITAAKRASIPASDFAGPDRSFPVDTPKRANSAFRLAGHAADPSAVRSRVKKLADEKGFGSALPETAKKKPQHSVERGHAMGRMRVGR